MEKVFWEESYQTLFYMRNFLNIPTINFYLHPPIISPLQHNKKHTLIICASFFTDYIHAVQFDWFF
jgi:hypothetical protein